MKIIAFYKDVLGCNDEDEVFAYLRNNLKPSILLWNYFVNWNKVIANTREMEVSLNIFNYLIGKENFDEEFKNLVKEHPEIVKFIPALVVRDGEYTKKFKILVNYQNNRLEYEDFDFSKEQHSDEDIEKYLLFMENTGIKSIFVSEKIKNLVDYMFGVEAGLDSNGRKNRGGHSMEDIVETFIANYCAAKNIEYLKEANSEKIKAKWDISVPVDKSSRRYDFVVNDNGRLLIFETNFYSGGGSKLKSTAGEYRNLFDVLGGNYDFIWITDGRGWLTTQKPLRETFNHNDYVFTLDLLEKNILDYI